MHAQLQKAQEPKPLPPGPVSPVPRTAEAIVEALSTTNTDSPEHVSAVMFTLPVKVQVDMPMAVMEGAPPRVVETTAATVIGSAKVSEEPVIEVVLFKPSRPSGYAHCFSQLRVPSASCTPGSNSSLDLPSPQLEPPTPLTQGPGFVSVSTDS